MGTGICILIALQFWLLATLGNFWWSLLQGPAEYGVLLWGVAVNRDPLGNEQELSCLCHIVSFRDFMFYFLEPHLWWCISLFPLTCSYQDVNLSIIFLKSFIGPYIWRGANVVFNFIAYIIIPLFLCFQTEYEYILFVYIFQGGILNTSFLVSDFWPLTTLASN